MSKLRWYIEVLRGEDAYYENKPILQAFDEVSGEWYKIPVVYSNE